MGWKISRPFPQGWQIDHRRLRHDRPDRRPAARRKNQDSIKRRARARESGHRAFLFRPPAKEIMNVAHSTITKNSPDQAGADLPELARKIRDAIEAANTAARNALRKSLDAGAVLLE